MGRAVAGPSVFFVGASKRRSSFLVRGTPQQGTQLAARAQALSGMARGGGLWDGGKQMNSKKGPLGLRKRKEA